MKGSFSVMMLSFFVLCAAGQQPVLIKGSFSKIPPAGKIFFSYKAGDGYNRDSAILKNGAFACTIKIDAPGIVYITRKDDSNVKKGLKRDALQVFVSPGTITIKAFDSLINAKVEGSALHNDFLELKTLLKPSEQKKEILYREYEIAYKAKDEEKMNYLEKQIDTFKKGETAEAYEEFIVKHQNSAVALYALENMTGYEITDVPKTEILWNKLPPSLQQSKDGQAFAVKLDIARKTQVGKPAMDFTQNDPDGRPVKFSDFRGNYVLLEFWASWCGPCRKENPNIVKAYHTYKSKQFTVLGVSLDNENQKDRWLKAIKVDGLDWAHVSDLKGWNNEVAIQYGIKAIPQNLLIGPDGLILAKNLREENLWDTLKKIFGE